MNPQPGMTIALANGWTVTVLSVTLDEITAKQTPPAGYPPGVESTVNLAPDRFLSLMQEIGYTIVQQ